MIRTIHYNFAPQSNRLWGIYVRVVKEKNGVMEKNANQTFPTESESYLREIRDAVVGIHETLQKIQRTKNNLPSSSKTGMFQHQLVDDVVLNKDVLLELLHISNTTLAKWRYNNWIKCKQRTPRLVEYSYKDVMDALADNRLIARGFDSITAYKRLLAWYSKNIGDSNQQQGL